MVQLSNISKQHGSQILFRDASCQILPGTHTGLVGPNGAGKTTFARAFLPREAGYQVFFNADLIAAGLSPFAPEKAAMTFRNRRFVDASTLARNCSPPSTAHWSTSGHFMTTPATSRF